MRPNAMARFAPLARRIQCIRAVAMWMVVLLACHREPDYDGRPLAEWFTALSSRDASTRARAADVVARAAPHHPETVRRLLDALASESDSSVHVVLAGALAEVVRTNGATPEVVVSLAKLATDEHESVRMVAAIAVARAVAASPSSDPVPQSAFAALAAMMNDPVDEVRIAAVDAVGIIARARPADAAAFADSLARLIRQDRTLYVRIRALDAFAHTPSADSLALAIYALALRDRWVDMPRTVLRALPAQPRLASVLTDSIARFLNSDDQETRYLAIAALEAAAAGPEGRTAIAWLERARTTRDSSLRLATEEALRRIRGRQP